MSVSTRPRVRVVILLAATIAAGLISRLVVPGAPEVISKHLGDFLWSFMFYFLVVLVRPRVGGVAAAVGAFGISAGIEFLKLYDASWINALREYPAMAFLLGRRFLWANFIAYAGGALVGLWIDRRFLFR